MYLTDDVEGLVDSLLSGMGFGEDIGNWTPGIPAGSAEYPEITDPANPGTGESEDPGQDPGTGGPGAGTDDKNGSGDVGDNGAANGNGSDRNGTDPAAVQTGDTANVVPYAAALLVSAVILLGAVLAVRKRRK